MTTPRISVLLPVRNGGKTLCAALESLQQQTFPHWETLIVDDGSTDDTPAIAQDWSRRDPRFRLIQQPARGIVSALNQAYTHARAPYIARMDADDICLPTRLQLQRELLEANPALDLASCQVHFGGNRKTHPGYAHHIDWLNQLLTPEDHRLNRFVEAPIAHPTALFRRTLWEKHGGYREGPFPEDYELWLRWFEAGARFQKVPQPLLIWNDPPDRLSRTHPRYAVEAFYQLKCEALARILPHERPIWLWGAGRITRRRFAPLETLHHPFAGYIDIDPNKIGTLLHGKPVRSPDNLPKEAMLLIGVGTRGARERIHTRLLCDALQPGKDFWLCA